MTGRCHSVSHPALAVGVPLWQLERTGAARLLDTNRVLEGVNRRHVVRLVGGDQRADGDEDIARADLLARQDVLARLKLSADIKTLSAT